MELCNCFAIVIISSQTSINEISGIGDLCALDPEDNNFYNLRNVDDAAKSRKKEQQRMREERIQNNRLRKQQKIREAKEIVDNALKIREKLHEEELKFMAWREEQRKQRLSKQDGDSDDDYFSIDEGDTKGVFTSKHFTLLLAFSPTVIRALFFKKIVLPFVTNLVPAPTYCS